MQMPVCLREAPAVCALFVQEAAAVCATRGPKEEEEKEGERKESTLFTPNASVTDITTAICFCL